MRDLVIIGGGPAGCSAGIYAARKKLNTLLITKDFTGQVGLSSWIENYPGFKRVRGLDLVKNFTDHLKSHDITVNSYEEVLSVEKGADCFKVITDEDQYQTKAIIAATGGIPRKLGAENEEKYIGKGISYCVTCDANSYEGKTVAIIGGGNAGAEAAIEMTRFAKKVYLMEMLSELTADDILIEKIKVDKKIKVILSAHIEAFEGADYLNKIIYNKNDNEKILELDGCFVEIGTNPNASSIESLVETNSKGEIKINSKTCETSVRGIFAAGDVTDIPYKQIIISAGQGAVAALSSFNYLQSRSNGNA